MSQRYYTEEGPAVPRIYYRTEYTCDKCGEIIPETDLNHLQMRVNPDDCVSTDRYRDYCSACFEPIWIIINEAIGANPNDPSEDVPGD